MTLNNKLIDMLLRSSEHFELVGELDIYGNGTIVEVNTRDKFYLVKTNWQGTCTNDVVLANTVQKEINKFIKVLENKDFKEL